MSIIRNGPPITITKNVCLNGFLSKKVSLTQTSVLPLVLFISKLYLKTVQRVMHIGKYKYKHDPGCTFQHKLFKYLFHETEKQHKDLVLLKLICRLGRGKSFSVARKFILQLWTLFSTQVIFLHKSGC